MVKSTHKAEVVPVVLEKHPNGDNLSIVRVFGYTVVVNTKQWEGISKAVYIVPDSLVDVNRPEFSFLDTDRKMDIRVPLNQSERKLVRVKVKKLRGVISMGLLIPAPEEANIGDDLAEHFGIERYEPPLDLTMGDDNCGGPSVVCAYKYDVDSYHRYLDLFKDGEEVYITEKIHGANARYVYVDEMYCGSRTQWKKQKDTNIWWRALNNTPALKEFCQKWSLYTVYGEVYGQVQNLKYGCTDVHFLAFDILKPDGQYLDADDFMDVCYKYSIPQVPIIENGWPLDKSKVLEFAEGKSLIADHVREGCVIKPMKERYTEEIGRLALKIVGNGYYEKVK